jgi:hypothetical protein
VRNSCYHSVGRKALCGQQRPYTTVNYVALMSLIGNTFLKARVAELVDALDLGSTQDLALVRPAGQCGKKVWEEKGVSWTP